MVSAEVFVVCDVLCEIVCNVLQIQECKYSMVCLSVLSSCVRNHAPGYSDGLGLASWEGQNPNTIPC